ncbi:hypothetical protein [Streptomyces aureoverticillatus]|uniref:hypothetical protein n=1 Tax=Streptomyces aureoverticillatus TaxID=66871 RepID=UPI0013DD12F0|nr:hypothetical protein [Streptomyces aureoverticillatus]QIB49532.1 hypothetical protein G3H79_40910 [Streptomyces aureoverticillatus]
MSDTFAPPSPLRRWAGNLIVCLALAVMVCGLMLGPMLLLHHICQAFTNSSAKPAATQQSARDSDACDLIVGPAKEHCRSHGETDAARPAGDGFGVASVVLLAPALLGVAVVLAGRRSTP